MSKDVFEDRESPSLIRSPESSFTEFVQYKGVRSDDHAPPQSIPRLQASTAAASKAPGAPVMQRCLEHFQHFLCRLVERYIAPGEMRLPDRVCVFDRKECVSAFTAACQLFLECSSFPVYIAEGNLKSPSKDEHEGKSVC